MNVAVRPARYVSADIASAYTHRTTTLYLAIANVNATTADSTDLINRSLPVTGGTP